METFPRPAGAPAQIRVIHGIVETRHPEQLAHLNFHAREALTRHLTERAEPYVDLAAALAGRGDALTIDDATGGAYDAAVLARRLGHEVTLFVNPYNVATGATYFFARLNLALDSAPVGSARCLGREFDLRGSAGRRELRRHAKRHLRSLAGEGDRRRWVQELAAALGIRRLSIPHYFRTLRLPALRELRELGVRIGNHGWSHGCVGALAPGAARDSVVRGRKWIEQNLGAEAELYAVPFGLNPPSFALEPAVCRQWLLSDGRLPPGPAGPGVFNRLAVPIG